MIFTYALRYWVTGCCRTPLRTGNTENDPQQVLHRADGRPMLQASSLAGALREALPDEMRCRLFGSQEEEGSVLVSDLLFQPDARIVMRPRLHIDPGTGCAADGFKFDMAHLESGSRFSFALVWRGTAEQAGDAESHLNALLAALDHGAIRLGGQKSNGFGQVQLTDVHIRRYDLFRADDRSGWLEDTDETIPAAAVSLTLPAFLPASTTFSVHCRLKEFLVRDASPRTIDKRSVAVNLTDHGRIILPGSALKGAMRAHLHRILPYLSATETAQEDLFGCPTSAETPGKPGRLQVSDAVLRPGGTAQEVTRIRINRFTGGVMRKILFSEEPHSGWCDFTVTLTQNSPVFCALLLVALRDLGLGQYELGSGSSHGWGRVQEMEVEICTADGRSVSFRCADGQLTKVQDPDSLLENWMQVLGGDQA